MIDATVASTELDDTALREGGGPIRVLLVEDEPAHVRVAQRAFATRSGEAFELSCVDTVAGARSAIAEFRPELVIADVKLPDGRGTELIPAGDLSAFGVVIMTAQGDEATAVEALKKGALDYVVKSAETLVGLPDVARRAIRVRDHIEARRMAESRLREEERRLRTVHDAIPDLIVIISRNGEFLECRGGKRLFGAEAIAQFVGKRLNEVVAADTLQSLLETIDLVISTQGVHKVLFEMLLENERRFVDARVAPYSDGSVLAIVRDITDRHQISARMEALSDREREVLGMVSGGASNKQIAARLDLSIKTVEAHRSRLMKKLGARNMAELMQLAMAVKDEA